MKLVPCDDIYSLKGRKGSPEERDSGMISFLKFI